MAWNLRRIRFKRGLLPSTRRRSVLCWRAGASGGKPRLWISWTASRKRYRYQSESFSSRVQRCLAAQTSIAGATPRSMITLARISIGSFPDSIFGRNLMERKSPTDPIIEFRRRLEGSAHREDELLFKQFPEYRNRFNLHFPPPAFIGDIKHAPIIILMANGGCSDIDRLNREFRTRDRITIQKTRSGAKSGASSRFRITLRSIRATSWRVGVATPAARAGPAPRAL
jgi:hypothetical protein